MCTYRVLNTALFIASKSELDHFTAPDKDKRFSELEFFLKSNYKSLPLEFDVVTFVLNEIFLNVTAAVKLYN